LALSDGPPPAGRLGHFTPLRYPGGKGKLAPFVKQLIESNGLSDGEYAEPYAGGAAIALELLFHEYVSRIHINDISRPVYAFWRSVLDDADALAALVVDTPLTVDEWDSQKQVYANHAEHDNLKLGFATFYLNRTNRSGILNGGIIGGRDQTGPWKIDARYNARDLAARILAIGRQSQRIAVTNLDACEFIRRGARTWPERTLVYLDTPYFAKGRHLYHDFYRLKDHTAVAAAVLTEIKSQAWIVSYDDVPEIRSLYSDTRHNAYALGYSARTARAGAEVMFFKDGLTIPPLMGPMRPSVGVSLMDAA
jgi:DNA adenine methylase